MILIKQHPRNEDISRCQTNKYHVTQDISAQTCLIVFKLVLKITGSFLYSMCIERLKARRHGSEYGLVILQHHKCPSQIRKLTRRSNYRDTTFQYAEVIVSHQASIMNSSKRQLGNQIIKDFWYQESKNNRTSKNSRYQCSNMISCSFKVSK